MGYPIFHSQYTAAQIEASIGKTPRIKAATRTWEIWDIATSAYVDTGVSIDTELFVDDTLSQAGYAADAKAAGDAVGEIKSAMANEFSTSINYGSGDYTFKNGNLEKFTVDHSAGAWNAAQVEKVELAQETVKNKKEFAGKFKADEEAGTSNRYLSATNKTYLTVIKSSSWNASYNKIYTNDGNYNRGAIERIFYSKNMKGIYAKSGYSFYVYGANIPDFDVVNLEGWVTSYDLSSYNYDYICINLRKTNNADIREDDLSDAIYIEKYTTIDPYVSKSDREKDYVTPYDFGAVGDGSTDDTQALQAWLDSDAYRHIIPSGTYLVTATLELKSSNRNIVGVGDPIVKWGGANNSSVILIGNDIKNEYENLSISLAKGSKNFPVSSIQSPSFSKGDIIICYANESTVEGYGDGIYSRIDQYSVSNGITLESPSLFAITINKIRTYSPVKNVNISGVSFINGNGSTDMIYVYARNVTECTFDKLTIQESNGKIGILVNGLNTIVSGCLISGFIDKDTAAEGRTGYGISVSGHNITVCENDVRLCKHCISSASRIFWSTGIKYLNNVLRDVGFFSSQNLSALLDFHASVNGALAEGNTLILQSDYVTSGMPSVYIRCKNARFVNNNIISNTNETYIVMFEEASDIVIANNNLQGGYIYIADSNTCKSVIISENTGVSRIMLKTVDKLIITNNAFVDEVTIDTSGSTNVITSQNV